MSEALDNNRAARDAVLARVRKALSKDGVDAQAQAKANADAYIAAHRQGPRPDMPADLRARFIIRATDMSSTVESIATLADVPAAVARYLDTLARAGGERLYSGVCWPEFANLDWAAAQLAIEPRPAGGEDRLGITGCFCAVADIIRCCSTSHATSSVSSRESW